MKKHRLYKTRDADAPEGIKDRNGEVVLDLCRDCGAGESQLSESYIEKTSKRVYTKTKEIKMKWIKITDKAPPLTEAGKVINLILAANDGGGWAYTQSTCHPTGLKGLDDKGEPIYEGYTYSNWDKHFQRSFGMPTHYCVIEAPDE